MSGQDIRWRQRLFDLILQKYFALFQEFATRMTELSHGN
jgi:hypothetical protein